MNEQLPKDQCDTPLTDVREENARQVLADENKRLLAKWKETFDKGAILP